MKTHVFIPTRNRVDLIEKTADKWLAQDNVHVTLVIEPDARERRAYSRLPFDIQILPRRNMGMGRIRQSILNLADEMGLPAFVQADDDSYPQRGNVKELCDTVIDEDVVGCGASSTYHGLMLGNEIFDVPARFPISGGYGHIMFGINTELALEVGGYPSWCTAWGEDTELQRQAVAGGYPWFYSTNVRMASVAKRYSPGGLSAQYPGSKRSVQERKCHKKIYERWPKYISHPDTGRFRCYWKRFTNDHLPGWEDDLPNDVREALRTTP